MSEGNDISCPVCGYYCAGKGGIGCIDKPAMLKGAPPKLDNSEAPVDEAAFANQCQHRIECEAHGYAVPAQCEECMVYEAYLLRWAKSKIRGKGEEL